MKRFLMLHYGFEKPTPEIMQAWGAWFEKTKDATKDKGHLPRGVQISKDGAKNSSLDATSLTGFSILEAESLEAAQKIAEENPFIHGIHVYEIMEG